MLKRSSRISSLGLCCALALLSLAAGCRSSNAHVSDGQYHSPDGLVSLPLPEMGPGRTIEDGTSTDPRNGRQGGYVSFHDDFGQLRAVTYAQVPPEAQVRYSDPATSEASLTGYLHVGYLPSLEARFAGTKLSNEGPFPLPDGARGWFSVVEIPQGSTVLVRNAAHPEGRRLDTARACLIVFKKGLLLQLETAGDFAFGRGTESTQPAAPSAEELAAWKRQLSDLYASLRIG